MIKKNRNLHFKNKLGIIGSSLFLMATPAIVDTANATEASFPNRPIKLVVPFPPGGATDTISREIANTISSDQGWTIVVDNKPGAGGTIGVDFGAKSAPNGYTLIIGQTGNLTVAPAIYKNLTYDPVKDFAPIASIAEAPMALAVTASSPFQTLEELIEYAKKNPEKVSYASSGNGSLGHLAAQHFQTLAGIKLLHIPYKGANQALVDVISGTVNMYVASVPSVRDQIQQGLLRPLAVTAKKRTADLPNTPTVMESGYDMNASAWFGLIAPANTDPKIIDRIAKAVNVALEKPEVQKRLAFNGATPTGGTPEDFKAIIANEIPRWKKVVQESGAIVE